MNLSRSFLVLIILIISNNYISGQFNSGINYQAVLRDGAGVALSNENIVVQVEIRTNTADGSTVYSEEHSTVSTSLGLINLVIGNGSNKTGNLEDIDWSAHKHFLKILTSVNGGSLTEHGTSELLSVPYAYHANTVSDKNDADADPANELQDLILSENNLKITNNASATEISLSPYLDNTDSQKLTIDNNTLSISGGNSVVLTTTSGSSPWQSDAGGYNLATANLGIGQDSETDNKITLITPINGILTQTTGTNKYGLKGRSIGGGDEGYGVWGWAANTGAGVYGEAAENIGVKGFVWNSSKRTYGGHFTVRGPEGVAVFGENVYEGSDISYGGHFMAHSEKGIGVYGKSDGDNAIGILGNSSGGSGVVGESDSIGVQGIGLNGVIGISENQDEAIGSGGYFKSFNKAIVGVASDWEGHGDVPGGWKEAAYGSYIGGDFTGLVTYPDRSSAGKGVKAKGGHTGVEGSGNIYGVKGSASMGFRYNPDGTESIDDAAGVTGYGYMEAYGVYGEAESSAGVKGKGPTGVIAEGTNYDFYAAGSGTNYGPFTGAHDALIWEETVSEIKPGMIVSVTGQVEKRMTGDGGISISSTLPTVKLADKLNDKAVFGVVVKEKALDKDHWYKDKKARAAIINALGEGRVWVCNVNGEIEAGDYITTSNVAGYGQKQNDDLLHNYTLAKATETIDWSEVNETVIINGKKYKVYLLAVVYVSG